MQTNNSGLGEEYTQRTDLKVNIGEITPQVFEDSGVARYYQNLHPLYSGINPIVFRNKILTDSEYQQKYVNNYGNFILLDENIAAQRNQDPQAFADRLNKFRADLINNLTSDTRRGQSIPDAIVDRSRQLRSKQGDFELNSKRINSIVNNNLETYKQLGILNSSGEMLYDIPALNQRVASDEDLQRQLLQDNYNNFLDALSKSHNEGSVDDQNVHQLAQAFAVYDNFGQEGLTHFANLQQHYQSGVPLEQQDQRVRQALTFMSRSRKNGKTPFQYMDEFLGSSDDESNMIWQPEQTSLELGQNLPIDLNQFTSYTYQATDSVDYMKGLMAAAIRSESGNLQRILRTRHFDKFNRRLEATEIIANDTDFLESVAYDLLNDLDSRDSQLFHIDLFRYARSGEGTFNLDDVVNTVISNADNYTYDPQTGKTTYHLNYDESNIQTRLALRILEKDVMGHALGLTLNENTYSFEPARQERIQNKFRQSSAWSWEETLIEMEDGTTQTVLAPSTSIMGQLANTIPAMSWTTGQFINDYVVRPTSWVTGSILNNIGLENLTKKVSDSSFGTWVNEAGDFRAYEEVQGFLPTAGIITTELAGYILGAMALGKATVSSGGAAAAAASARLAASSARIHRTYTSLSQARTVGVAATTLNGHNKYRLALNKIANTSPTNRWMFFPRIEIGSAQMEILGGQRRSLWYNEGVQDIINSVAKSNIDIQSKYLVSDRMTQIGMDAVTSLAIGTIADNVIAAVKYAGRVRGVPQRGLAINKDGTDYIKVAAKDIPFAPDWRRAWFNLTNGLQDIPIGSIADSKANEIIGRGLLTNAGSARTLADIVTLFKANGSELLKNMRDEIEQSIRAYDIEFGRDIRLDDADIIARRDRIYAETLDNIAKGIGDVFNIKPIEGGAPLNVVFAEMLSEIAPTIRRIEYVHPDGTTKILLSKAQATTLQAENPGSVIRRIGNAYQVYEVDPDHWSTIMAQQIRNNYANTSGDEVLERMARSEGIDRQAALTPEQQARIESLADQVENVIGRPIVVDGKLGRVIDFDDTGYTVITRDGEVISGVQNRNLDLARKSGKYDRLPPFLDRNNGQFLLPARSLSSMVTDYMEAATSQQQARQSLLNSIREDAVREYVNALDAGFPGPIARAKARLDSLGIRDLGELSEIPALRQAQTQAELKLRAAIQNNDDVQVGLATNTLRALGMSDEAIEGVVTRTTRPRLLPEVSESTGMNRNLAVGLSNYERAVTSQDPTAIREAEQALRSIGVSEEQLYQVGLRLRSSQLENAAAQFRGAVERGDITAMTELRATLKGFGMSDESINALLPRQQYLPAVGTITNETRRQELITRNLDEAIDRVNAGNNPESAFRTLKGLDADLEQIRERLFQATQRPITALLKEVDRVNKVYKPGAKKDAKLADLQRNLDLLESDQRRAIRSLEDVYADEMANATAAERIAKSVIESSRKAAKLAEAPEGKLVIGPNDTTLNKFGLSKPFIESVLGPVKKITPALVRKMATLFGVGSNQHYYALGKNIKEISVWQPKKGVSKGTIVKHNGNHYIARQTVPAGEHVPSQWVVADNNTLMFNKYWAKVDINETLNMDGTLFKFVVDQDELGTFYRPYREAIDSGKQTYNLNIQKPIQNENVSFEQIVANEIDAIVIDPKRMHYRIFHSGQAIGTNNFDAARTTDLSSTQVTTKFRGDC